MAPKLVHQTTALRFAAERRPAKWRRAFMQTFMSAEKVCTLRGMPRLRISAIISSALRSCWCDPHCGRQGCFLAHGFQDCRANDALPARNEGTWPTETTSRVPNHDRAWRL